MENFKGYVYTIFSGLLLLAAVILAALQWGNVSEFSLYGKNIERAPTIWLVLGSAAGGILAFYLARLFVRGVWILHRVRSAQRKVAAKVAAQKADDAAAARESPAPKPPDADSDNSLSPR